MLWLIEALKLTCENHHCVVSEFRLGLCVSARVNASCASILNM
jgi:hypothetical protein